jgi:transcriptional regulator with XRE-family HTH domain
MVSLFDDPPLEPHRVIAARVKELRKARGYTAAQLAEKMKEQHFDWDRFTVQNLESGRRKAVTVEEWLALAYVLDVAPIHLMVPTEDDERFYAVTPEDATPANEAREWIRGRTHIVGRDPRLYYSAVPAAEWQAPIPTREAIEREGRWLERQERRGKDGGGDGGR